MKQTASQWETQHESSFSGSAIEQLLNNRIPAIRISGFASDVECRALSSAVRDTAMEFYENVEPPIGRIGITQFECRNEAKSRYFHRSAEAEATRARLVENSFDPVGRLVQFFADAGISLERAVEPGCGTYFAGIVRQINRSALLHVDVSALDAADWEVGQVESQLAWNLFLRSSGSGGECVIYNRQWLEEDEAHHIDDSYGYDCRLVEHAQRVFVAPICGDVVIFNCRNYHEVRPSDGDRITMGSFIGKCYGNRLVLWS